MCDPRPSCASQLPRRPADWRDRTDGVGNHADEVRLTVWHKERSKSPFQDLFNDFTYYSSKPLEAAVGNVLYTTVFMSKRQPVGITAVVRESANKLEKGYVKKSASQ